MKKLIMILLFCMMVVALKSSMTSNVCGDLVEGEIYPDPFIAAL